MQEWCSKTWCLDVSAQVGVLIFPFLGIGILGILVHANQTILKVKVIFTIMKTKRVITNDPP